MNEVATTVLWVYILVFCRIGTTFALLPGFAGLRLPSTLRLLTAIVVTMVITPLVFTNIRAVIESRTLSVVMIFPELLIGLAFGFWCHCFMHASRFAASIISSTIGLAGIPGQPFDDQEPTGQLATLMSMAATMLVFSANLHLLSLSALLRSYESMPVLTMPDAEWLGMGSLRMVKETSLIAVQVAGPFIILSVIINMGLGLCGKFTPQLQIYFAFAGATIVAGMLVMSLLAPTMLQVPVQAYAGWLAETLG